MQQKNLADRVGRWEWECWRCLPFLCRWGLFKSLRHGLGEVGFIDDVVAVEHRPRFPAAELHDLTFRDATAPKVPRRGPPKVMR